MHFSTRLQRFAYARLLASYLTGSSPAFSSTLTTIALYDSSLRWFEARSRKLASRGLSLISCAARLLWKCLTHSSSFAPSWRTLVQMPFTWGWFGQGGIQRRIAKLLWLLRYPGSEPDCATWAFPRQIKLTCGRRIKRLHQYPACGGWGSGGRDHTYRRQFKPMASSIRPPGSAETDQVSVDCVNPLRWPMRRPSRWRLL